jgi:mannose-6-phosphate isomerase-like protein (cupin superfamily)
MRVLWNAIGILAVPGVVFAQTPKRAAAPHVMVAVPDSIRWGDAPPVLPAGAKAAILEGNPLKPGPFTLRLSFPDGYTIAPHYHPSPEHVTVLKGTLLVGMGTQLDPTKFNELPTGTFGVIPPRMRHFARAKGDVIIQLHGTGPWRLIYVNPADDPRGKKPAS